MAVMVLDSPIEQLDRRQRLIRAGIKAFGTMPYDDVRVSEVAAEAGVASGLPFHYFESKRGFYLEVVRQIAILMRDVLTVPRHLSGVAALHAMLDAHLDWLESHPDPLRELLRGPLGTDPEVRAVFDEARWDGASQMLAIAGVTNPGAGAHLVIGGWIAMKDTLIVRWLDEPVFDRALLLDILTASFSDIVRQLELKGVGTAHEVTGRTTRPGSSRESGVDPPHRAPNPRGG